MLPHPCVNLAFQGGEGRVYGVVPEKDPRTWPGLAGGCHCARDTRAAIEARGFAVDRARDVDVGPSWGITNPHVLGSARAAQPG